MRLSVATEEREIVPALTIDKNGIRTSVLEFFVTLCVKCARPSKRRPLFRGPTKLLSH